MSTFNLVFKYARKESYIFSNPFEEIEKIKIDKAPNLFWLEPDHVDAIMKLELEPTMSRIRHAFVFCCYTGLSIGDYELLNPKRSKELIKIAKSPKDIQPGELIKQGDRLILIGKRRKTGTLFRVPLGQKAIDIIEIYGGINNLPFSLYTCGYALNQMAKSVGITKVIRFHTARKTFANHLLNVARMNPFLVKDVMGWVKIEEAEPYTRISNDTLVNALL